MNSIETNLSSHIADADDMRRQNIFLAVTVGLIALAVVVALLAGIISQVSKVKPFRHRLDLFLRRGFLHLQNADSKQLNQISNLKDRLRKKRKLLIRNLTHIVVTKYHELTMFTQGIILTPNLNGVIKYYMSKPKKPLYISAIPFDHTVIEVQSTAKMQTQMMQTGDLFMGPLHPDIKYSMKDEVPLLIAFWYDKPFPDENRYDIQKDKIKWLHPKRVLKQLKIQIVK